MQFVGDGHDVVNAQKSYSDMLRSSSIMAGATALEYIMILVRVKVVAVLLGPTGVGLISLYSAIVGILVTASGMGVNSSGVREVTLAYGRDDSEEAARTVRILYRVCWLTGVAGWLVAVGLAVPISHVVLGSGDHVWAIAILGGTVLLSSISSGQKAVLQGMRRIWDLARINVAVMFINTVLAVVLYIWLGERGIVPVLLASAAVTLAASYWFSRGLCPEAVDITWLQTIHGAKKLARLGVAFMLSGVLAAAIDIAARAIITKEYGLESAGHYQAAWAISGLFAGFILSAMGTDFYPRLTAVIHDHALSSRTVNEQTEIGILLALPGLLGTLALSPLFVELFYSDSFLAAAELLPWFVLGVFARILSWPLAFIQVAKGASGKYMATETAMFVLQLALVLWLVPRYGIVGAAYASALAYFIFTLGMLWLARMLIGFRWSPGVKRLLGLASMLVATGMAVHLLVPGWQGMAIGVAVAAAGGIVSLKGLASRLGHDHRMTKLIRRIPLL